MKYSICITNYNMKDTLCPFIESIISQIDSDFEVIVCDSFSDDGSLEILNEYVKKGKIKLILEKSSRGRGRQIAFQNSKGDYIISGLDTDDVVKPCLRDILDFYHVQHEGFVLSFATIHFIPRKLVNLVGGWRDLQWGEDIDFCKRVESLGKMHYFNDASIILEKRGRVKRDIIYKVKESYRCCSSKYQIGLNIFGETIKNPRVKWYFRPFELLVAVTCVIVCKLKQVKRFRYE